ncbi:hypothetical protein B0T20DRAFT_479032 [Sordaria brevicollis]|uniref:SMODS and SLOG-associating 2TM effector domain-containing protein n=1 Tax=Sordaria brevicollis TaxID=83679 RepID=A0AAE0PE11_SORBR|nr:hypothetical protein B0T20DRAFT_479032 [Sordaria brevicollis]
MPGSRSPSTTSAGEREDMVPGQADEQSPLLEHGRRTVSFDTISSPVQPEPSPRQQPSRSRSSPGTNSSKTSAVDFGYSSKSTPDLARRWTVSDEEEIMSSSPPFPPIKTSTDTGSTSASKAQAVTPTMTPVQAAAVRSYTAAEHAIHKADTNLSWGDPAGLPMRGINDENLVIFRRAIGINSGLAGESDPRSLEEGRKRAVGMYAATMKAQREKRVKHALIDFLLYASHLAQILIGATLTAFGPSAGKHAILITVLGAINTVIAGVLALIKGQGLPERLRHDQSEFRKLQDWIEQTEALLAVGVIGRNRKEVGLLVQVAFKKYNAVRQSEENNRNENYVRVSAPDPQASRSGSGSVSAAAADHGGHTGQMGKLLDHSHEGGGTGTGGGYQSDLESAPHLKLPI